ncbi:MAG: hypothetical protein ACLFWG_05720 [Longimicrobiales bacterium]
MSPAEGEPGSELGSSALDDADRRTRRKFRQAAFFYLHVGLLYEAAVWVLWRQGAIDDSRGPVWMYLVLGAVILGVVFWGLWSWRSRWFARIVWGLHALRIPALIEGSFLPETDAALPPSFYLVALAVVVVNLWMLARAGWDL